MKKTKVDDNLYKENHHINKVLGAGTFNCAHLVTLADEDVVMRVGLLEYEVQEPDESAIAVLRGLDLVSLLQREPSLLGPSLLKEKAHYVLEPPQFTLTNNPEFCAKIKEQTAEFDENNIPYKYAVQYIEYLQGGLFKKKLEYTELVRSIFCLLWFIHTAQKRFEFSHRDLKPDNIVFRTYEKPKLFTFYYGNDYCFSFFSAKVPVIIDFDLSTVGATQHSKMDTGTRYTAPPESILIKNTWEPVYVDSEYFAYDYWSIGVCILETIKPKLWKLCRDFRIAAFREREVEYDLIYCLLLTMAVTNNTIVDQLVPSIFFRYFTPAVRKVVATCIMSKEFNDFTDKINNDLHPTVVVLLTKLLSWTPEVRTQLHLFDPCFYMLRVNPLNRQLMEGEEIYYMQRDVKITNHEEVRRDYKNIAAKCISCLEMKQDLKACTCCAAMFCGEECHLKMH
jgi:serine/threonine protein kinase